MSDVARSGDKVSPSNAAVKRCLMIAPSFSAVPSCLAPVTFDCLAVVGIARHNDDDQRRERERAETDKSASRRSLIIELVGLPSRFSRTRRRL
jgi:hypothetical protein